MPKGPLAFLDAPLAKGLSLLCVRCPTGKKMHMTTSRREDWAHAVVAHGDPLPKPVRALAEQVVRKIEKSLAKVSGRRKVPKAERDQFVQWVGETILGVVR